MVSSETILGIINRKLCSIAVSIRAEFVGVSTKSYGGDRHLEAEVYDDPSDRAA